MDIKKELAQLNSSKNFGEDIVDDLASQLKEFKDKVHLFNVIFIANKIEDAVINGFFINEKYLNLDLMIQQGFNYNIMCDLLDEDRGLILDYTNINSNTKQTEFIQNLFNKINGFSSEDINSEFDKDVELELKLGIKDKIIDLLLSKELKATLEYNKMGMELPKTPKNKSKNIKM